MGFFDKLLFGTKVPPPAPQAIVTAAVAAPVRAPVPIPTPTVVSPFAAAGFIECVDRRFFEVLETYQNRIRPLNDLVTWDLEEENRLKNLRIEAYQLRNGTDYKPHDVFHLWPYQPVDPDHVIKRVALKTHPLKPLPEFSQILHVNVVSERVMKAITALEEGRHAFYPLEIVSPEGDARYRYHFMQFLERIDCTVPKLGGFRKGVRQDGSTYWVRNTNDDKAFLDAERVGARHFFYDKRAKSGWFISGDLAAKLGDFLPSGLYLTEAGLVRRPA